MSSIVEKLEKLSKDKLINIIDLLIEQTPENKKMVELESADNLTDVTSLLVKEVNAFSRKAKIYDFKDSILVSDVIYDIVEKVDKYLVSNHSSGAVKVLKKLIAMDEKLFDHIDDSYANMSQGYMYAYEILDRAFANSDESPEEIAKYIIETSINNPYGVRDYLLRNISKCLQGEKALALEKCINNYTTKSYFKNEVFKKVADLTRDVNKYILAIDNTNPTDILEIAKRFMEANQPEEAIEWLLKIEDRWEARELLAKAYQQAGNIVKAQEIRWNIFKLLCSIDSYTSYIAHAPKEKHQDIQVQAIEVAKNTSSLESGALFLKDIKKYDLLETLLLKRYDEVRDESYYTYRPISIILAEQGKYLIASLLRRKLAQGGVAKANTKYYKYAADDYKFCNKYAQQVQRWGKFKPHQQFISEFKERHKRKSSFWSLVS